MMNERDETTYVDPVAIAEEIIQAKKTLHPTNWPIIDISRRSIEETAAAIIQLRAQHQSEMTENTHEPADLASVAPCALSCWPMLG